MNGRHCFVNNKSEMSKQHPMKSEVPQGSVLGLLLYILFTADLPIHNRVLIAVLAVDKNPVEASKELQKSLDEVGTWADECGIKMNETKSVHITFTTRFMPSCIYKYH